jgi:hypothetical protein
MKAILKKMAFYKFFNPTREGISLKLALLPLSHSIYFIFWIKLI